MTRLALFSFAHLHAESYLPALLAMPDVTVIGVADDDLARGRHFAEQHNVPLYGSYAQLLAEQPDGVVICSENNRHAELTLMAAQAGVHVLSEKPLATTLGDGRAMLDAAERGGIHLMTAFPMRFSAPVIEVKRLIDSGRLGTLYACNTTNQGECPQHHRAWFVDRTLAGGGAIMDHTVHLADLLRWFLASEVVEVYAAANSILYADQVAGVETGGLVMLTFANGVFASIDCSWSKPPYYPTWGGLTMEIVSEAGLVTLDAFRQLSTVYTHALRRPRYDYWGSDANSGLLREFAASIHERRTPAVTGDDGYRALEIVAAAYRSVETGAPVRLPLEG